MKKIIMLITLVHITIFANVYNEYRFRSNGVIKTVVVSEKELKIYEAAEKIYKNRRCERIKNYNRNIDAITETYNDCITEANSNFINADQDLYITSINRCISDNVEANKNNIFIEPNFMDIVNEIKRINGFTDKPVFDPGLNDPTIGDAGCDDPDY